MWNSPVFSFCSRGYQQLFSCEIKPFLSARFYSELKNTMGTPQPVWAAEKYRILELPLEEKRKLYKSKTFVTLDDVPTWKVYADEHLKDADKKQPNLDDITHFKNITLNKELNSELANLVSIFKGDITHLEVDAIVNAANSRLKAGGGVDGAIHKAAGRMLQAECDSLGGCPLGQVKMTSAYNLPAQYVIHTVGPQDGSEGALKQCYENSLKFCIEHTLQSIAFPCISTGIYGFPHRLAAHIALKSVRMFLEKNRWSMKRVIFCLFMPVDIEVYEALLPMYFPLRNDLEYPGSYSVTE